MHKGVKLPQGSVAEVEIEGPPQLNNLTGEKRGDMAELTVKRTLTNLTVFERTHQAH